MKRTLIATLSLLLVFSSVAIAITPQQTVIPTGTPITVRLRDAISTESAKKGHRVLADIESPSVLPPGSMIVGELVEARRSGRIFGKAKLAFRMDTLQLPNGQQIKIRAALHRVGAVQIDRNRIVAGSTIGRDVKAGVWYTIGGGLAGAGLKALTKKDEGKDAMIQAAQIGGRYGAAGGAAIGVMSALLKRGRELQVNAGEEMVLIVNEAIKF
jgi:hypothetical protein